MDALTERGVGGIALGVKEITKGIMDPVALVCQCSGATGTQ